MKAYEHFKTVNRHRWLVMKGCFSVGLYRQGICHDLSKYSPVEFLVGAKYYQGTRSPNNAEREKKGYSQAWLHHKGRNKHHYEYWIDYSTENIKGGMAPAPMPIRYILEMIMDRIAASKVYSGEHYSDRNPLIYYLKGRGDAPMHPKTKYTLDLLLQLLALHGEKKMIAFIRKRIMPCQRDWDDGEKWPVLIRKYQKKFGFRSLEQAQEGKNGIY